MIRALCAVLLVFAAPTHEQGTPISPCPNVFSYEPPGSEAGRWYGVVNLSTDSTLHSLWLNIVLDSKADILGNWVGDVSTSDNIDFKIENTEMKINPGPATAVRFFVQYNQLNKTPRLQAIRLNGRDICNANTPRPSGDRQNERPSTSQKPVIKPEERPYTRPTGTSRPSGEGPVYVRPSTPQHSVSGPLSISGGEGISSQSTNNYGNRPSSSGYDFTPSPPRPSTSVSTPPEDEYFNGPSLIRPGSSTNTNSVRSQQCGVVSKNPVPLVINGTPTLEGQWPWQVALYQTQTVDNKYICGGTLVSHLHIITAAHCVTKKSSVRPVLKNTLTVYLGKHNLRTSVDGVQIRLVDDIIIQPNYNASVFSRDIAILRLREPVTYTDWVRPACLWPDNQVEISNVVGKRGSVVGWGYDDTGVATEELSLVEMPVVSQETCIRSYSEFFVRFTSAYTYCAGFRDGTSVCNGDSGGGMVFKIGNAWYVRGLVSVSVARENEYRCDPSHYVVFTDIAKFLPWIRENVSDY